VTCGRKIGPFDCCSVVQGDCLELIQRLPAGSIADTRIIDLLFADPPYGINKAAWDTNYPSGIEQLFLKTARCVADDAGAVGAQSVHPSAFHPYLGSGTTAVAAKKLGRHYLGFEISPEYCEIARKRLDAIDAQPSLFAPKPEQMSFA
jgi:DNA modification methylase